MIEVLCPLCGAPLTRERPAFRCPRGHSFDVARQGYVNLLPVHQKHSLHPGDTREMVAARRAFLEAGFYAPIADTLENLVRKYAPDAQSVLDAGCGEGYYLSHLSFLPQRCGIDISKEAVRFASGRDKEALWLTASAARLPFPEESFDCLLSMFALTAEEEFARVLKPRGIFIQVLTGENHLSALRHIIYPRVKTKEKEESPALTGFRLLGSERIVFDFHLDSPEMVYNLLCMTPHVFRISREGAEALRNTPALSDRAEVLFHVYEKAGD